MTKAKTASPTVLPSVAPTPARTGVVRQIKRLSDGSLREVPWSKVGIAAAKAAKPTGRPLTAQMVPHYSMGLLVLSAAATRAAVQAGAATTDVVMVTATTALVVAVGAAFQARKRLDDRRDQTRALLFIGVAASWPISVTASGLTLDAVGLLAALGYGLSLYWWRKRRIANGDALPTQDRPVADVPRVDRYESLWAQHLGCTGGEFAGSKLTERDEIGAGVRYVLKLVPGKQSLSGAYGKLEMIRSGLQLLPAHDMIVEAHPKLDASNLLLTIVTKSPVVDNVEWPGPRYDRRNGRIPLGPFIDGEGTGFWRVASDHSLWSGFMCGSPGSGKSRCLESIALSLASAGFVVLFGDPQQGASSTMLAEHADFVARGVPAIGGMLAGLELVMELREAENALDELEGFTHSEKRPGVIAIIDECQDAFAVKAIQAAATRIARKGRKVGVAIIAASQVGTLDAFGPSDNNTSDALRSCLTAGNLLVLRCTSSNPKSVFQIDINPMKFPPLPGYAFLVDRTSTGRSAPLRAYWISDEERTAAARSISWRGLDDGAATMFGREYVNRKTTAAVDKDALRARVEALRAGRYVPPPTHPTVEDTVASAPIANVIQFPVYVQPQPVKRELLDSHRQVLDAIRIGHRKPGAIATHTGISERHVYNVLEALAEMRLIDQPIRFGPYELVRGWSEAASGSTAQARPAERARVDLDANPGEELTEDQVRELMVG